MDNRDKMQILKSAATNAVAKMAFVSVMVFGCDPQKEVDSEPVSKKVTTLQDQPSPCMIEVACNRPELDGITYENGGLITNGEHIGAVRTARKFYNFCDSTVSIVARGQHDSGPLYSIRPITELLGTEKAEMKSAYAKYRQSLNPQ